MQYESTLNYLHEHSHLDSDHKILKFSFLEVQDLFASITFF